MFDKEKEVSFMTSYTDIRLPQSMICNNKDNGKTNKSKWIWVDYIRRIHIKLTKKLNLDFSSSLVRTHM